MAMAAFTFASAWVMADEGGYSNDPHDSGGPTKYGITLEDTRRWLYPGANELTVRDLVEPEARLIYRRYYWSPMGCDVLPFGLDYAVFDSAILQGVGWASRAMGQLSNIAPAPDKVTDTVLDALARKSVDNVIEALMLKRWEHLRTLKSFATFGHGWTNRLERVRRRSLALSQWKAAGLVS